MKKTDMETIGSNKKPTSARSQVQENTQGEAGGGLDALPARAGKAAWRIEKCKRQSRARVWHVWRKMAEGRIQRQGRNLQGPRRGLSRPKTTLVPAWNVQGERAGKG